jgi:hypothetical protein
MPGKARKVQANSGKVRRWASIIPALRFRGERSGHPLGIAAVEQEKPVFSPRSADERRHGVVDIPLCLENQP